MRESQQFLRSVESRKQILMWQQRSGLATGASWLCYFHALQEGPASVVVPIDKLSILVTIAFSLDRFPRKAHTEIRGWCDADHTSPPFWKNTWNEYAEEFFLIFEKIIKNYLRGWKYQKTLHCAKNG